MAPALQGIPDLDRRMLRMLGLPISIKLPHPMPAGGHRCNLYFLLYYKVVHNKPAHSSCIACCKTLYVSFELDGCPIDMRASHLQFPRLVCAHTLTNECAYKLAGLRWAFEIVITLRSRDMGFSNYYCF